MRDGLGQPLKEGNLVQVMLGQTPVRGYILKMKDGGISLVMGKGQPGQPQAMTPDVVIIQVDVALADVQPGQPHPTVLRLPDPGKEVIMSMVPKDVQ